MSLSTSTCSSMTSRYNAVSRQDIDDYKQLHGDGTASSRSKCFQQSSTILAPLVAILFLSCSLNVYSFSRTHRTTREEDKVPSRYGLRLSSLSIPISSKASQAHLYRDIPTVIAKHSEFDSANRTIEDLAWESPALIPAMGTLALDESWAISKGLPPAQSWPWDEDKGIYILESFHIVHCLVSMLLAFPLATRLTMYPSILFVRSSKMSMALNHCA